MRYYSSVFCLTWSVLAQPIAASATPADYSCIAETYPDLAQLISRNYLHRHMALHGHMITLDDTQQPHILYQGQLTPWTTIRDSIEIDDSSLLLDHLYTYEGLVPGTSTTVVRPFKRDATRTEGYALEVITYTESFPPHVWVRLIDKTGHIISAGFFPKDFTKSTRNLVKALIPGEGYVHCPDVYEVRTSPDTWVTTSFDINEQQYQDALTFVVAFQQDPTTLYQLIGVGGLNCVSFVKELCKLVDVDVSTTSVLRPVPNPYDIREWQLSCPYQ